VNRVPQAATRKTSGSYGRNVGLGGDMRGCVACRGGLFVRGFRKQGEIHIASNTGS